MSSDPKTVIRLCYGLNPHQAEAELRFSGTSAPIQILCGAPSYINLLDALRGWRLVRELRHRFNEPAAASFKHVNPAGVALGCELLTDTERHAHFLVDAPQSPLAVAYIRARQADRISSYGDFAALSDVVDAETANVLKTVASDGAVAPGFTPEALSILTGKRDGRYLLLAVRPDYEPRGPEIRDEFGFALVQDRDTSEVPDPTAARVVTKRSTLQSSEARSLLLGMIVAKHAISNAVVLTRGHQTIGIGAGQQSRISATRIACAKAEAYLLYDHPKILDIPFRPGINRIEKMNAVEMFLRFDELGREERAILCKQVQRGASVLTAVERAEWLRKNRPICLASDGAIPFRDNIDRATQSGVTHVAQPGGSIRDQQVTSAADQYGMIMIHTGQRHFLH
jgi:phosphoribosylaminoimidazolecarboxamide formyltransferase / IMP cyclohydrolase